MIIYDAYIILMLYDEFWWFMMMYDYTDDIRWLWNALIAWHVATLGSPARHPIFSASLFSREVKQCHKPG